MNGLGNLSTGENTVMWLPWQPFQGAIKFGTTEIYIIWEQSNETPYMPCSWHHRSSNSARKAVVHVAIPDKNNWLPTILCAGRYMYACHWLPPNMAEVYSNVTIQLNSCLTTTTSLSTWINEPRFRLVLFLSIQEGKRRREVGYMAWL